ncbi:MAG TPA: hypothetical protein VK249_20895, partial [Anaerolineales bacterium]|nr:hypothetical protein [Anaerolineales bacterium]
MSTGFPKGPALYEREFANAGILLSVLLPEFSTYRKLPSKARLRCGIMKSDLVELRLDGDCKLSSIFIRMQEFAMSENAIPPVKRRLQWPWKWKWLRSLSLPMRILVIVATFLLLTFTVNVLSSVLGPLYSVVFLGEWSKPPVSESTRQILKRSLATDFSQIQVLERSITVTSSAEEMQIAFRLVIPTEDPIASRFAAGVDREHPALLTDVLFGTLQVDHSLLTYENFRPSQLEVDPKNTTLTLQAVFPDVNYPVEIVFTPNVEDKIQPEVDKLLIEMSDSMLIGMNPIPDRADQQNASLVKQAGEELPVFRIEIDRAGNFTRNESNQNNRLDRRSFLLKAGSFLNNIPLGSRLLFALSKSAPLLLFLWLATRP